ncbi:MAG: alpha,alpha-trehalase [Clostridia bacterium]|nr:alpha,alpha-trehalase [Clostridia bacterium]
MEKQSVYDYIKNGWDRCTRDTMSDDGTLIGLPYPYTVPSEESFNELYYWDTYFTNVGLLKSERAELAKNNTDNILYLVDKYGFMPNGNRTYYLNRSQPPFLSEMVRDVYEYYQDKSWLKKAYDALKKEYSFWMTKRITPIGLNRYDSYITPEQISGYASDFRARIGTDVAVDDENMARHGMVTAESGWDMNPRWKFEGYNYAHVDLNSLLYLLEKNMAYFSSVLNENEEELWNERKEKRAELMEKYMLNSEKLYLDYNYSDNTLSDVFSVASLYPMFAGLATKEQAEAVVKNLGRIEEKYGVACCEKGDGKIKYQWDYPNGWACLQYVVIKALQNYGYNDHAQRIARKYINLVEAVFEETGNLWEKYNVADGNINVQNEYKMPKMLGWSAGVYLALCDQ